MSKPASAARHSWSKPVVTPVKPPQYDGPEQPDSEWQHSAPSQDRDDQPQRVQEGRLVSSTPSREAPPSSPSRAESPTSRQWSKSASSFTLKRASTTPVSLEKTSRPTISQSPQLSERDSIFATHYLPPDSESATPRLNPVQGDLRGPSSLTPTRNGHSPSPSLGSPFRSHLDTDHLDDDMTQGHQLSVHSRGHHYTPSKLGSSELSARWEREQGSTNDTLQPPEVEGMQPLRKTVSDGTSAEPSPPRDEPSHRTRLPSASSDTTVPSRRSAFHPYSNELASVNLETISYQEPEDFSGSESHGPRRGRSSSKSHRGRVEHSIEANLTNAEPATHVRSRKSSHYLGLFKENTGSPDRKRREERERKLEELHEVHDHQDESQSEHPHARERHGSMSHSGLLPPIEDAGLRTSKSLSELSLVDAPTFDPKSRTEPFPEAQSDNLAKLPYRALPRSLLEEIRNFHLTPGGARGSSFSKSIPMQFSEGGQDYFGQGPAGVESSPPLDAREDDQRRPSGQFEDEDEENEQISSAVYFPHERVTVSDEVDHFQSYDDGHDHVRPFEISAAEDGHVLVSKGRGHEQEPNHVDISLRSKNDSRILHGDLQDLQGPVNELHEKPLSTISERSYDSAAESDLTSADDSSLSAREEDSSLTDDAEMTPTATPTQSHRHIRPRRKHTAAPVGAVELKPYRHQVGGHTTVFRFSRRAVCKQLNNRENEFYERIEHRHPEMLMFLPRYIGVLNVTFSKNPKRPKLRSDGNSEPADGDYGNENADKRSERVSNVKSPDSSDPQRIFSQKQVTGIIPKVILENNRHIIPADLFSRSQRPRTADDALASKYRFPDRSDMPNERQSQSNSLQGRPAAVSVKTHNSWGATTVNRKLQEQVLREVFSPPAIHHHRRHARGHITMPKTPDHGRRRPNLSEDQTASSRRTAPERSEPPRSSAIDIAKQSDEGFGLSSSASTALDASRNRLEKVQTEEPQPRANSLSRTHPLRRRHSGGGLQRRGSMNSKDRGDLMFFEDEGYGGDKEDDIFSMEGDPSMTSGATSTKNPTSPAKDNNIVTSGLADAIAARGMSKMPARFEPKDDGKFRLPSNPKEAQTRKDDRVQFFLLLEDLTAGMNKPCVLDLKMGTRQYGIEADEKKRKSQRRKCQTTTSQQLGVRLCGMQTWNVKKQEYSFEDKYFGRDLSSGREFRDALTRFLYDGVSYGSVTKKIPVILEKLLKLESMIRKLKSYRLYASSLLILYDGEQTAAEKATSVDPQNGNKRNHLHRRVSDDGHNNMDVQLKIVDFANCVTGEDELPEDARCPPRHPDDIDRGYVRGLRTLRMYFQRILKEVGQDEYVERGEGEAMALRSRDSDYEVPADRYWDDGVMEDDRGEVSV